MQTEDRQIIHQCLNGDTAMFGFLVDKYKEGVYALAYSRLHNFHDAQDIAQEAFIKAYHKLRTLKHWDNFALWLSAITNNLCKNFIRSKSNRPDREFADDQSQEIIDHTSVDSYRESLADESLKEALNSLPEIYRQVLVLHYLSGYTSMDMAHLLGISIRTVAERLRIGRERLKEEMVNMMSATLKEQRLPAGFTFRIVEMVKKIRINPITQSKGLPWGLSLATGIIITIFCLNPYMAYFSHMDTPAGAPLPGETKVLKVGEIPVDILKTSQITVISSKVEKGKGEEAKQPVNTLFLAPQGEGGTWTQKADMPNARHNLSVSMVDGKIYAIGGIRFDAAGNFTVLSDMAEYDPVADKWTEKADMPEPRFGHNSCAINGKIYVIGGGDRNGLLTASVQNILEYDLQADKWSKKADLPESAIQASSIVFDGKIYIFGGTRQINNTGTSTVDEYDPIKDRWAGKSDMPTARYNFCATLVNGFIYVTGGMIDAVTPATTTEAYNLSTDKWERKADIPTLRGGLSACVANGKIYVIGGMDSPNTLCGTVEVYDSATDTWEKKADMPTKRNNLSTTEINGRIYAIGGSDSAIFPWTSLSLVEEYIPEGWPFAVSSQSKQPETWGKLKGR